MYDGGQVEAASAADKAALTAMAAELSEGRGLQFVSHRVAGGEWVLRCSVEEANIADLPKRYGSQGEADAAASARENPDADTFGTAYKGVSGRMKKRGKQGTGEWVVPCQLAGFEKVSERGVRGNRQKDVWYNPQQQAADGLGDWRGMRVERYKKTLGRTLYSVLDALPHLNFPATNYLDKLVRHC